MSLPILDILERWFSRRSSSDNNLITTLVLAGILFILLFTLASFALASSGEQFDEDDLSFLDLGNLAGVAGYVLFAAFSLGLELEVIFAVLRLEYLRGHIGEKRPSGPMHQSRKPFPRTFSVTAPFYGGVFFVPSASPFGLAKNSNLVFVRGRFTRSRSKKSLPIISGG